MQLIFPLIVLSFYQICIAQYQTCDQISRCNNCDLNTSLCLDCDNGFYFSKELLKCIPQSICQQGQYKQLDTSQCLDCHPTCKACTANQIYDCTECIDGYTFIQDNFSFRKVCVNCSIPNCDVCSQFKYCMVCSNGYYLDKQKNECKKCDVDNCMQCQTSSSICTKCFAGYSLQTIQNNQINKDQQFNQLCQPKGQCQIGYYLQKLGRCYRCDQSCMHCYDYGKDKCYSCSVGYFMNNQYCTKCEPNCKTCKYRSNYCTSCQQGYFLNGSRCEIKCRQGEYNLNGLCLPCAPNCLICTDYKTCTKCVDKSNYKISKGLCVKICPSRQYNQLNSIDMLLWQNFQFDDIISPINCQMCDLNCSECIQTDRRCTECNENYLLSNQICTKTCKFNQYKDVDPITNQLRCMDCQLPCSGCSDRNTCTSCIEGYQLSNGNCYNQNIQGGFCEQGSLAFSNPPLCFDSCPQGLIQFGTKCYCDQSCKECIFDTNTLQTICLNCIQNNKYSYQGACLDKCPEKTQPVIETYNDINQQYEYSSCVMECLDNQFITIQPNMSRSCTKECPANFELYKSKFCINKKLCPNKTYFDQKIFDDLINTNQPLQSLTYCKNCFSDCERCSAPLSTDCLICQEKLYLQEKFLDNLKIGNQCQQDCDFGYEQVKIIENGQTINQCKVCTKNCDSCINTLQKVQPRFVDEYIFNSSNINPNKYFCVEACPKYTFHNTETRECKLETILSFIFDENNNHIQQKYFTTDLIKFNLEIQSPYDLPEDTIVSCTILEINQYLQMQQNQFSKMFSSVINANILKEGRVYTLKCIVYMFKQKFENTTKIETLKLIAGEFSSNSTRGIAILDSFSFSINSYQFENISKEHYHFDYAVYVEKPVYNSQFMNFTLFQTNQAFYNQHPHLLTNFKYTLNYTFPYIKNSKIVRIILVATFQKIKDYQTIELKIDPFYINVTDVQTLIQKTILENNLQIGDPFNSEILGQFHNELLTLNIIPQLYPELLSYKKETNLLLQLLSYQTNCQSNVDCSNQGNCLKQIYSSYQKCQCNLGFLGEYCQWNAENYIEIQKIYLQSLPQLKYEIVQLHISQQSNQFKINKQKFNFPFLSFLKQTFKIRYNNVIEQIFQLCQMQDIINFQMSEMLAEIVLSQFFVHDKVILLNLEKVAFIVDVLLDLTIKFSELAQIDQTDKFQKLIHGILNIFNKIISNQGQKIQHKFNNLSVLIQDLTVMKNITLNSFQIVGYDVSVSLPIRQQLNQENNLQFMIFKHTIGFIKQKVDLDSDKFSIFASDIIVLMLKDKNEKNKSIYFVNEDDFVLLDIPISVKLEDTTRDKQKNFTYKCVQLIQNSTWSSQNIQMDIFDDFIRCKVRNLTSYAIQIVKSEKQNLQNESQNIEQPSETEISDSQLNPYVFFSINASALVFVQFAFIYYNTLKKKNLTKTPLQQEENQENNNQLQQEIKSEEKNDTEKVILQKQLVQGTSETEQFQQNAIFRTLEFQECKKENKADECFQVGQEVENFNKQQQLSQLNQEEDINKEKQPIYYTIEKDSVHYQSFPIQKKIFHKLKREKQIRFNFKQNFYDNKKSNFNSDQNQIKITRELSTEQQALQNQTEQEKQQDQTHSLYQLNNKNSVKICICYESSLNALPLKNQTNGEEFQKFSNNEQKILDEIKNQQPAQETIENKKNLIDYHPIFSFTRNLTHRDISSRIILFFQNLIFYELVSSIFIWKQNNLYQYEEINALFIICFFLISSSAKTLASLFIHIVVYLKVYISQKMKFKIQQPSLNITFRLINSFLQILFISILGIIVQCIQNPDQLRNFWILTAFNIILDLFVLDFFLIILLLKFHFKRGENWLRLKNNDLKLI